MAAAARPFSWRCRSRAVVSAGGGTAGVVTAPRPARRRRPAPPPWVGRRSAPTHSHIYSEMSAIFVSYARLGVARSARRSRPEVVQNGDEPTETPFRGQVGPEMTMGQRVTGHGSSGSTNMSGSRGSRVSTRDPLTHDFVLFSHCRDLRHSLSDNRQFNSIVSTGYFVAVMTFHFESTST